jgi:Ca-activated chloride channel family protein
MIVALSRPILYGEKLDGAVDAKELIIALDVSFSMRASDIKPTRLDRAKSLIKEILKENENSKISLFAFTTNPLILSPTTTDHKLLLSALESLRVENILTHGTDFKNLFERLDKLKTHSKNLLLFSDGGDELTLQVPPKIKVFAVGMATMKGSMLKDEYGKKIKDSKGNLVITRLNPKLKTLCQATGGLYMAYDELDTTLGFIKNSKIVSKQQRGFVELFWIPLLLSMILFFFYFVKVPKKVLALVPFLALNLDASLLDWYHVDKAEKSYEKGLYKEATKEFQKIEHKTMQSQMNLANSYYQLGSYKKAKSIYSLLKSTDAKTKKTILFKLGNCYAMLKEYEKAKRYYQKALAFENDKDIVYNLKMIALKIQEQRRDFPSFKSDDKERENTPQGSKEQKATNPSKNSKSTKTGVGSKGVGKSSKTKKSSSSKEPSKLTRPMGFKAYELINKGYISEKNPW